MEHQQRKNKTLIIAEAGVNHNGDINLAKKLIDIASDAKADYVKFQSFKTEKLTSEGAALADYQKLNDPDAGDQFKMLKRLELSIDDHKELMKYARQKNVRFLSTGFDEESVDLLEELGVDLFKVPSGELTNIPLVEHIAKKNKPVILSTGMASLDEIKITVSHILKFLDRDKLSILHCNTAYPTPIEEVHLNAMKTLQQEFKTTIGYSDHTLGIEIPLAAVALGAQIIEKHFTISRTMDGPDHRASLVSDELKTMISGIRNIEKAMGRFEKKPTASEKPNIIPARRSIYTAAALQSGEKIDQDKLIMLRPGDGISPMELSNVIGKIASRDLPPMQKLKWSDIA